MSSMDDPGTREEVMRRIERTKKREEGNIVQATDRKFWCDRMDMDLYELIPETLAMLAPFESDYAPQLVTRGTTGLDGRLLMPSLWHGVMGLTAYFDFDGQRTSLIDYTGPQPDVCITSSPLHHLSFAEMIRDCWLHQYAAVVDGKVMWDAQCLLREYNAFRIHLLAIGSPTLEYSDIRGPVCVLLVSLRAALQRFRELCEKNRFCWSEPPAGSYWDIEEFSGLLMARTHA